MEIFPHVLLSCVDFCESLELRCKVREDLAVLDRGTINTRGSDGTLGSPYNRGVFRGFWFLQS